jgi:hypothetical protein
LLTSSYAFVEVATTGLRLLGGGGRTRRGLSEIHGLFNQAFDTADLKDAKALLDELGNDDQGN